MKEYFFKSWEWFAKRAEGTHAKAWLAAMSFAESSFFIIPPDILLVAILLVRSERWIYYASLTTVSSVAGALFGYILGLFFYDIVGEQVLSTYGLLDEIEMVKQQFSKDTFLVILFAAFTPIPFKVFVFAGGFLKVNIFIFLAASIIGRGLRYFTIAYIVRFFGSVGWDQYKKYTPHALIASVILLIVFIVYRLST